MNAHIDMERVRRLFQEVCDLSAVERAAVLDRECAGEPRLRAEVESLLGYDEEADDGLAEGLMPGDSSAETVLVGEAQRGAGPAPERVGPYRVVRLIGAGGMGRVYEAEQESPRRRVALKVMHADSGSARLVRRFWREGQIQSGLVHPGIAQVYSAGIHHEGARQIPYIAMEFVDGLPVIDYVEKWGLSVAERLEILIDVCQAVQFAHQHGVIHRDLKPDNVLVQREGESGRVKVLDFGIAKLVEGESKHTTFKTEMGQIIGTLPYMSPEQISGRAAVVDTRADIYALGCVAYELLGGRCAFETQGKSLPEAARLITETEPTRLGTLDRRLAGDLDAIVGKCLEKDPARRYGTAAELANDLRAYLANEPIKARPPSAVYQVKKFVRRKPGLTVSILAAVVAMIGGTAAASWQAVNAQHEAQNAQRELSRATAVKSVLETMIKSIRSDDAERLDTSLMKLALNRAAERLNAEGLEDPVVEADLRQMFGKTYRIVGDFEASKAMLERALAIRTERLSPDHVDTLETEHELGHLCLDLHQLDDAEPHVRAAYEGRKRVLGLRNAATLESASNLGELLVVSGRAEEGGAMHREVLGVRREMLGNQHKDTFFSMLALAMCLQETGKLDEMEALLSEASEGLRAAPDDERDTKFCILVSRIGAMQGELGKNEDAERNLAAALEQERRIMGADHPETLYTRNYLAIVQERLGQMEEAEAGYREALEGRRRRLGADHLFTLDSLSNLANLMRIVGRYEESEPLWREAVERSRRTLGEDDGDTLRWTGSLAQVLLLEGKAAEAESIQRGLYERSLRARGGKDSATVQAAYRLAGALHGLGRDEEAAELLEPNEAIAREAWWGKNGKQLGQFLMELGESRKRAARWAQAETILVEARTLLNQSYGPKNDRAIECTKRLARVYDAWDAAGGEPMPAEARERRVEVLRVLGLEGEAKTAETMKTPRQP
ncbi:MAG TPA: tetratricopeptide repeat protein [Phycisphaerales bacterium]|nr:tetratricopeptide repeat protein [Phycisphaerales bacterium]